MYDPIIVTGCARSRTSLVMQLLEIAGLHLGNVIGATKANPQGQKENRAIIDQIQKPILKSHGYDPKGQFPIPHLQFDYQDPTLRHKVLNIMKPKEGQRWGFKDAKACLTWRTWNYSFPDASWIIVRRWKKDIVKSCLRTSFMDRFQNEEGWAWWVEEHKERFDLIRRNCKHVYEIDTDNLKNAHLHELECIVNEHGLKWLPGRFLTQIK